MKTVTLQHGLYVDYGGFPTVNCINYLHQPSEYFLSWGRNTTGLIERYHPKAKVIECGKPIIFSSGVEKVFSDRYISVILDQRTFHDRNIEMIEIALEYGKRNGLVVAVRIHPHLSRDEILGRFPQVIERSEFVGAEFIIGHTSTMIYEAICLGCRVFRYRTTAPAIGLPEDYEFDSLDGLFKCLKVSYPTGLSAEYFCAVGEDSLVKYRGFFASLRQHDS